MLSVCFITKNEEKNLGDCLSHLQPIVEEFIVVDTGSTDRTKEIADGFGARVFDFKWRDDFSAARNFALQKATQPWILQMDPDERIDPNDFNSLLEVIKNTNERAFKIPSRTYTVDEASLSLSYYYTCTGEYPEREKTFLGYNLTRGVRIFKRDPSIYYIGRVHETITHNLPKDYSIPELQQPVLHNYSYTEDVLPEKDKANLYRRLLEKEEPHSQQYWFSQFTLGSIYLHESNTAKAIPAFEKALAHRPQYADLLCNYGYALTLEGQFETALISLKKCIRLYPFFDLAWVNLGVLYLEAGTLDLALQALERALDLNPQLLKAKRARGQALARLNRISEAEETFIEILQYHPEEVDVLVDLAMLYLQTNRAAVGLPLLRKALRIRPKDYRANLLDEANK